MRWRTIDRIDSFEPWCSIAATKAVSFEEGALLERFGRESEYPFTLVLEGCVEAARWLVAASSGFLSICLLESVECFRLEERIRTGDCLRISVTIGSRSELRFTAACRIERGGRAVGSGVVSLALDNLGDHCDPADEAAMWKELHAGS